MRSGWVSACAVTALAFLASCGNSSDQSAGVPPPPAAQPAAPAASSIPGYEIVSVADGGSISGAISVSGMLPKLPRRQINKDPDVCGRDARESERLLVSSTGGLRNAVVIVEDVKRGKTIPAALQNPQINQKNCEYTPHVMVMPVNAELAILNSDPTLHNIHFYQNDESLFNIAQPTRDQVNKRKMEKAGMVFAECDVHGWMQGHVAVVSNPYFAITDADGKFSIPDLPAGTYKVKVWHEYLGEKTQDVAVSARADTAFNLDLKDVLDASRKSTPAAAASTKTPAPVGAANDKTAARMPEVVVKMRSDGSAYSFEPATITVKVGTTVKWVNESENRHSATDDPKFEKKPGQAELPAGAEVWSSTFLVTGESFTKTFTLPGKYRYFCRNHGQFDMEGTIIVEK